MIDFDKLFENEQFLKKLQSFIDERLEQKIQKQQNQAINDNSFTESSIMLKQSESANDIFGDDESGSNKKNLRNEFEKMTVNHKHNEESITQFIDEVKKEKDEESGQSVLADMSILSQQDQIQFSQQMESIDKRKGQIISQLNNALIGIANFNMEQQMKKIIDSIESRLCRCEKVCLEKLIQSNYSSSLNNQNLESISKNFSSIQGEIKKINSFLEVIQDDQLHFKLKIEESFQTTKRSHHSRVKSVSSNQNHLNNSPFNGQGGGGDFIPLELVQELSIFRIDIDAKDEQIKNLEHKIIKVQQDCFRLEEDIEEKLKINEDKIMNIWQSIAFMTEDMTEIKKRMEKKKGLFF